MSEIPLRLVLHYPNGDIAEMNGYYKDGLAYGVFGVSFIRKVICVFNADVAHLMKKKTFLGKISGLNIVKNVLYVDVNGNTSMGILRKMKKIKVKTDLLDENDEPILEEKYVPDGESIDVICVGEFDSDAYNKIKGLAKGEFFKEEKRLDVVSMLLGGMGAVILYKIIALLLQGQGIVI